MKRKVPYSNSRGFTLVELAIVLVIIGLIVAGVLKGRELISNSKAKNVANQAKSIEAAIHTYQDKYKFRPGDDPGATTRWVGSGKGPVTAQNSFPGDGWTPNNLALAGLITGQYSSATINMTHKLGGEVVVDTLSTGEAPSSKLGTAIIFKGVPSEIAEQVDNDLDDGRNNSGTVVGVDPSSVTSFKAYTAGDVVNLLYFF